MGWINEDHPGHEGYLVALVEVEPPVIACSRGSRTAERHQAVHQCPLRKRIGGPCVPAKRGSGSENREAWYRWLSRHPQWRELRYADEPPREERKIFRVQVACDCGWRSQVLRAPFGTTWSPSVVWLPEASVHAEAWEEAARKLWGEHARAGLPEPLAAIGG